MTHFITILLLLVLTAFSTGCGERKVPDQADERPGKVIEEVKEEDLPPPPPMESPVETKAPEEKPKPKGPATGDVTLHGEIVDLINFVASGVKSDPETIARAGRAGNPLAFYDGQHLYLVGLREMDKGANETLLPYVGTRVFISGRATTKHGMNVIILHDIGKSIR